MEQANSSPAQRSILEYRELANYLQSLEDENQYLELCKRLARTDLYFLLRYVLKRTDAERQWILDRCREVQASPDGHIDIWSREHFKSSIITVALTIQNILCDPELTVGIFSHTRPIAKAFLNQIRREFEANEDLKAWFPDILYTDPKAESPKWSENDGIIVKRKGNPKESTVEAWGLVDGQPTSKHFALLVYDDVVTRESVSTPDMIRKVTQAWELSRNLTTVNGRTRYVGTFYHFADTYREIINRGAAKLRKYPATKDGTVLGEPVIWTPEILAKKRREMQDTFAAQILCDPSTDSIHGFKNEWVQYYDDVRDGAGMNKYILVDPANSKKRQSDYTAMFVVGLGLDSNYYVLDMIRDRLDLSERADALFALHKKWRPINTGYEQYGMQADIDHIKDRQNRENYRFPVTPLKGKTAKEDRIAALKPILQDKRLWFPETVWRTNYEGKLVELMQIFIEEEYKPFPVGLHDDMLDALARILDDDLCAVWPKQAATPDRYARHNTGRKPRSAWAA